MTNHNIHNTPQNYLKIELFTNMFTINIGLILTYVLKY